MKFTLTAFFFSLIFLSCSTKTEKTKPVCWITYESLFKNFDTSRFDLIKYPWDNLIEVFDKPSSTYERGLFKFDTLGHLKFYTFLSDKENNTIFYIEYDSIGRKKRVQYFGGDVLLWHFKRPKPDSIVRMEFLLCELDCKYRNIKVESGKFKQENARIFQTQFLKVIGVSTEFPSTMLDKSRVVYVTGQRQDNCSGKYYNFRDTIIAP